MSFLDDENAEEPFDDKPEEIQGTWDDNTGTWQGQESPPVNPQIDASSQAQDRARLARKPSKPIPKQELEEEAYDEDGEGEENEDFSDILNDANLRLEQGQLYKMVLNNDLFADITDMDKKAITCVQKEIRKFAKERMEVMLGMRQEPSAQPVGEFSMEAFPFNSLEVEVLKSLAATATKGATDNAAPFTGAPRQQALKPISGGSRPAAPKPSQKSAGRPLQKSPEAPVKRSKMDQVRARIMAEEGVTQEEWDQFHDAKKPLTRAEFARMTEEEIIERNRNVKTTKPVQSTSAIPMPTAEHIEAIYTNRAAQAAANPQMQMIMQALEKQQKR